MASTTGSTFGDFARSIATQYVPEDTLTGAFSAMGGKAEWGFAGMDGERRRALIGHFVRSLRNVGVHTAHRIESELLTAAGCVSAGHRMLPLRDAISLIAVRNQIHQTITALGAGWNGSMRYQSALSDIARYVIEHGGGRMELEEGLNCLRLCIHCLDDLGSIALSPGAAPTWLAATLNLTKDVRITRSSGGGSLIEIKFEKPKALVA